jgi:dihydroneopterin aldolase
MSSQAVLKINDLTLSVHLGCTPEERAKKQEVRISFQIKLGHLPGACLSDRLSETVCYETLIESVKRAVASFHELHTIEKLAQCCFQDLKEQLPEASRLFLSIHKANPPIDFLKGGVCFELSDEGFSS